MNSYTIPGFLSLVTYFYCQLMHQRNAQATNRSWNEPEDTESGLPLGNDFNRKQQMEVQRNREYNEFLKKVFIAQHDVAFFFHNFCLYIFFLLLVILLYQNYCGNVNTYRIASLDWFTLRVVDKNTVV